MALLVEELCAECHEVMNSYDQPRRRMEAPEILKAKALLKEGWTQRKVAEHFKVSTIEICYTRFGQYDYRIKQWEAGKIVYQRASRCEKCGTIHRNKIEERKSWKSARKTHREIKDWLRNNAPPCR